MATLTTYPDADVAGDWEQTQPTPVNAASYTEPRILGFDVAGYLAEDSAATGSQTEALVLPDIGASGGGTIQYIGGNTYDGSTTFADSHPIPLPEVEIRAGDLIEIFVFQQDTVADDEGDPLTPAGYTQKWALWDSVAFRPHVAKFYKIASGGESGTVTVSYDTPSEGRRMTGGSKVWRGVDQVTPYDVAQTVVYGGVNPNPGSRTTVTNGAVVVTYAAGNKLGGLASSSVPSGYTRGIDMVDKHRSWLTAYKTVDTAGAEDPGAYVWGAENSTVVTDVLRPGTSVSVTALVITAMVDETATTELGGADDPEIGAESWTLEDSVNIPRAGSDQCQLHIWSATLTSYVVGDTVDITVSSHDTNHSWAAILLIVEELELTNDVQDIGATTTGSGGVASWAAVTPTTAGSKILALLAKNPDNGDHYADSPDIGDSVPIASGPDGFTLAAEAISDAITLSAYLSPPLTAGVARQASDPSWGETENWVTVAVTLQPDVAAGAAGSLFSVVDSLDETDYIEIAGAAGSMDEVLELDLSPLPTDAIVTAASIKVRHATSVRNPLRVELVGINADDTVVYGGEQAAAYYPTSLTTTSEIATGSWTVLQDGQALSAFTRLGVRLLSTERAPNLSTHKIFSVSAEISFIEGGPVVDSVTGPNTAGDPITWAYSSTAGLAQTHYRVMVISGSSQDPLTATVPANVLSTSDGEIIYDSGMMPGSLTRELTLTKDPIGRSGNTVAVKAWARLDNGELVESPWTTDNYDISGAFPANVVQDQHGFPAIDLVTGEMVVTIDTPNATINRAWLLRSNDSGSTWAITEGSPYAVTANQSGVVIRDPYCPLQSTSVRYQVAFDNGNMTEVSSSFIVGPSATDIETAITEWYMLVPDDPTLSFTMEIADFSRQEIRDHLVVEQPGNTMVVSSPSLGSRITLTVRTRQAIGRTRLEAILSSGKKIRLVNVLGQEWLCRLESDVAPQLQVWKALDTESTPIRDGHETTFTLREVG